MAKATVHIRERKREKYLLTIVAWRRTWCYALNNRAERIFSRGSNRGFYRRGQKDIGRIEQYGRFPMKN